MFAICSNKQKDIMHILRSTSMNPMNPGVHSKRTMPVCFNHDNLKILEDYAKKKGMLDYSQAVEYLAKDVHEE
jgi:hypothetical protein